MGLKKDDLMTILTVVIVANLAALAWFEWDSYSFYRDSQMTEERVIEVKKEVNTLLTELGREPRYASVWEAEEVGLSSDRARKRKM